MDLNDVGEKKERRERERKVLDTQRFFKPRSIDLMKISSNTKGAIGELIAWNHLNRRCRGVRALSATRPANETIPDYFDDSALPDFQRKYLECQMPKNISRNPGQGRRWDFVASSWQKPVTLYLIEVKTSSEHKSSRHPPSWHDRRKLPPIEEIENVKSLGFTPILLKVLFGENWRVDISCEQL